MFCCTLSAIAMASVVPVDPSLVPAAGTVAVVATRADDFDDDDEDDDSDLEYDFSNYMIRNRIRLMHHLFRNNNNNNNNIAGTNDTTDVSSTTSTAISRNSDIATPARGFLHRQHGFMEVRDHNNNNDDDDRRDVVSDREHRRRRHVHFPDSDDSSSDDDIENIRLPQRSGNIS